MPTDKKTLTITDYDGEFRSLLDEIAEVIHHENPFDMKPHQRHRFKAGSGVRYGDGVKLAIRELHKYLCHE